MEKINKVLYLVLIFFLGSLGIHKYLNGRILPGIVQLILSFILIGSIIALVEFIWGIIKLEKDENGEITIPTGFFDFL
ncbi:MAG: NINE protein [Candidatus Methanomethylophilaceae archaeon]|nr:NINE protein [Candidatus Methanomethylophilaceae archaeon]